MHEGRYLSRLLKEERNYGYAAIYIFALSKLGGACGRISPYICMHEVIRAATPQKRAGTCWYDQPGTYINRRRAVVVTIRDLPVFGDDEGDRRNLQARTRLAPHRTVMQAQEGCSDQ